ncbi:unnamed protein product, partial [Cyprideis torosa]
QRDEDATLDPSLPTEADLCLRPVLRESQSSDLALGSGNLKNSDNTSSRYCTLCPASNSKHCHSSSAWEVLNFRSSNDLFVSDV